jgi:ketosteroid isomerase-like protein
MTLRQAVLYPSLILLAAGCAAESAPAPAPAVDLAADEQAIRDISMQWLALEKARDAAGIVALLAEGGTYYRTSRQPIVGAAAGLAYFAEDWAANPKAQVTWATDRVDVAASGDIAVEYGTYAVTGLGADGAGMDNGKYTTVFHKVNGQWKVFSDMSMSTKPAPTP